MDICSVNNCDEPKKIKDLCAYHYGRKRYKGDFPLHPSKRVKEFKICTVPDCENQIQAGGLCMKHYKAFHLWKQKNKNTDVSEYVVKDNVVKNRPPIGTFL